MAVTMIIGIVVAIVELVITVKRKTATKKTRKESKTMLFKDFMKAVENTRSRKSETKTEEAAPEAEAV